MSETAIPRGFRRACKAFGAGLALLAAAGNPVAAQTSAGICRAPAHLPPCAAATSSSAAEPDLDSGLGNPVHLVTGAKYLQETDLPAPLDGSHPSFIRFYRTMPERGHANAPIWTHEYDVRLEARNGGWRLELPDGRVLSFDPKGAATAAGRGQIRILSGAPGTQTSPDTATHAWLPGDGGRLDFNANGQLLAIHSRQKPAIRIERHTSGPWEGLIHRIHGQRASLSLRYVSMAGVLVLAELQTPAGAFTYTHEPAVPATAFGYLHDHAAKAGGDAQHTPPPRLVRVTRPDGMSRRYHYEAGRQGGNSGFITGLSLMDAQGNTWRARTWAYDANGRVIRADPGDGRNPDQTLEFEYDLPGDTPATRVTRVRRRRIQVDIAHGTRSGRIEHTQTRSEPRVSANATIHQATIQRDRNGRLSALGALRLQRYPGGQIHRLHTDGGWPDLTLEFDTTGRRAAWYSTLTGQTTARFDAHGSVAQIGYANGDTLDITRDAAGRPARLDHAGPDQASVTIGLQWHAAQLTRLSHPAEDEIRQYDTQGRLTRRIVRRPHPAGLLAYQETFAHDAAGRLLRHGLPEGGALHYEWGSGSQLTALTWEARDGARHPVIRQRPGLAGYQYGNGLHLQPWRADDGRTHTLILSEGAHLLWGEQRQFDANGRVVALRQAAGGRRPGSLAATDRRYVYDGDARMVGTQQTKTQAPASGALSTSPAFPALATSPPSSASSPSPILSTDWFAWADSGALHARRSRALAPIRRDASGLPQTVGTYRLQYSAQRLLAEIQRPGRDAIRYTHNARGHTIRRIEGASETERYYLDNRLIAVWQRPQSTPPSPRQPPTRSATLAEPTRPPPATQFGVTQRYLYAHDVPVGLLQTDANGHTQLYYIHADALGAPVRVTDAARTVRWSATYDALGQAKTRGALDVPLRAPGQDEDPSTGWHDNVFRTYLPAHGQYLEPDPLGPVPGEQALGYAAQQPARYIDPLGLILLAFDGTRQSRANQGNVWKLAQVYQDGPSLYHAGPGKGTRLDWDAITAASSGQILRNQWQALLGALQNAQGDANPVPIDLLGFSRGAALARDFANRIARQTRDGWFSYDDPLRGSIGLCVDLRFLGLFDTVAQFGLLGAANAGYDLTIAGAWQWVAHAVALHEFRALFPLVSAAGAVSNVVEAPFIGAHADIGGGMALDPDRQPIASGDLSDVALNWMRWQALAAMVPMGALPAADRRVTQALLHDERTPAERLLNGDRTVQDATLQSSGIQAKDPAIGAPQRAALEAFIQRFSGWQVNSGNVVGSVDMYGYERWLQDQLGLPAAELP